MTHGVHLHFRNDAQSEINLKNKSLQGVLVGGITVLCKCEGGINLLRNGISRQSFQFETFI